jgi:ketosteroid isomerase-like protein
MDSEKKPSLTAQAFDRLESLLARQDIYDCLLRFASGIDRFDRERFLSAFHPDATISAGDFVGDPASLYDWARNLHDTGQSATQHNLLNHSCDVDGDTAHCETYYLFSGRNRDGSNWLAGGRYIDRFERRDGQWGVAVRCTTVEWSGTLHGTDIPFADVPDLNANGPVARSPDDLSYLRPLLNHRVRRMPRGAHDNRE